MAQPEVTVTVADILALPLLKQARVVAGRDAAAQRCARWVAVIEWPVESFVSRGELVLTSGVGCEGGMFDRLCTEVMDSGAAALFVGVGRGRFVERTSAGIRSIADQRRVPLVEIPWKLRFSEIIRETVNLVLNDQYAMMDKAEAIHSRFTSLIIEGLGIQAVADNLEELISRPVLIFDSEFRLKVAGTAAASTLGSEGLDRCDRGCGELTPDQVQQLQERLGNFSPTEVSDLPFLSLGPGTAAAAVSKRTRLAYIYALSADMTSVRMPALENRAMEQAAAAVALAMLRDRAVAEAEARVHGHFLWALAWGLADLDADMESKATALGYSTHGRYWVLLIRCADDFASPVWPGRSGGAPDGPQELIRMIGDELNISVLAARHDAFVLALLPEWTTSAAKLREFTDLVRNNRPDLSAGVGRQPATLRGLQEAYRDARRTLEIGEIVFGKPCVAHSRDLTPFLVLDSLRADVEALSMAREVLRPLLSHQKGSRLPLIQTLEVYFDEGCNTSAAARRLYLNRHSLLYRLDKIQELTGYDLNRRNDRFVLELSLRLRRFGLLESDAT